MTARLVLFAILPLILAAESPAQHDEREAGLPFLRNYSPREYGAQAQNWAVTQDRRGVIYIGNNDGVLIYDGVHWRTVRVTNGSAVRSLDVDHDDRVYVGARGEFGYLAPDESGAPRYVSLLDKVPVDARKFKEVWKTIATPEGVIFNSFERLFRYRPNRGIEVWKPAKRFERAFLAGDTVYVQEIGAGLMRLTGGVLHPAPGGEKFTAEPIYCVAIQNGKLLVGVPNGMFLREGGGFSPHPTEADAFLRKAPPSSCAELPGGGLVVTTLRAGAILLSPDGKLERIFDEDSGLSSDSVTSAHQDREGGLWLTMLSGVARVHARAPLTFFDERAGLAGVVAAIARHEGTLYAGTTAGLFRLVPSAAGEPAAFQTAGGIADSVHSLLSTEKGLLVGTDSGVYALQGKKARQIYDGNAVYDLSRSSSDPAVVFAAGADGLMLLRQRGAQWSYAGDGPEVDRTLNKTADSPSGLWLGTDDKGPLRVDGLPGDPAVKEFGPNNGLPKDRIYPCLVSGRVVFLTSLGIFAFDPKSGRFSPDPAFARLGPEGGEQPTVLVEDPVRKNIWIGGKTFGGVLQRQPDGSYLWDQAPLRMMGASEVFTIYPDSDGTVWVGTADGIVRHTPHIPKNYRQEFSALVRTASGLDGKHVYFAGAGEPAHVALRYESNSLRFRFAAPSFDDESRTEYHVILDGFDRSWSPWMPETRKDYTNLPEGSYVFRVEARNLYGANSRRDSYAFTLLPPWYRTWWAYTLGILGIGALVWLVAHWRLRRLAEQNRRLQKTVEERTAELREKNGALTHANETLNQMNAEKNEFMGIAAHDLKNPLGAIRGFAEMLEEDATEMPTLEVVDTAFKIKKSANLMFDLVSNLLDVNRIEQGKMDLALKPCDLWEIVRQAVEGYRQRALAKQIQLHFEERDRPPMVMADPCQLVQIMDNLVSNAVKYSPSGKNIFMRVHQVDSRIRAEVKDEGPGITAEDQKRLFGKFARLSARPTAGEHSTGLGLAIVKRLVESMQGRVWCESEPGKGASFLVELPMAAEQVPDPTGTSVVI